LFHISEYFDFHPPGTTSAPTPVPSSTTATSPSLQLQHTTDLVAHPWGPIYVLDPRLQNGFKIP
jgi:hypothetical protein